MIIAFYPGAGGNKYFFSTQDKEWQSFGRSYDYINRPSSLKYLYNDYQPDQNYDVVLTHCLDTKLIRKIWPNHEITVILSNMQSCLRREWMLLGYDRYLGKVKSYMPDKVEFYNAIKDPSWPDIKSSADIILLPRLIFEEVESRYLAMIDPKDPLTLIKQKYTDKVDSAMATIVWHKDYYDQYPLDLTFCQKTVDICGETEFAKHMQKELQLYPSEIFDDCWKSCYE
jgi:hypothetical protein